MLSETLRRLRKTLTLPPSDTPPIKNKIKDDN